MGFKTALKLTSALAMVCSIATGHCDMNAAAAETGVLSTAIPPMPLDTALSTFAHQTGLQVAYVSKTVAGIKSNGAPAGLSSEDTIKALLSDTGLHYRFLNPTTVAVSELPTSPQPDAGAKELGSGARPILAAAKEPETDTMASRSKSVEGFDEIIVTARRREESSMVVPVSIAAVGALELERRAVTKLDDLTKIVPQLQIGEGGGSLQGGLITLRGLGSGDGNPLADQSVSFVIDGVPVATAAVRRMSEVDIQQIEVLKGPQALFFGKNSPGGIISIQTADPTPSLAAKVSVGYEVKADETKVHGYLSGPLTDAIGARLAVYGDRVNGDVENAIPANHPLAPKHRNRPYDREYGGRLSLKWEPSDLFNARLKISHGVTKTAGLAENMQFIFCGSGNINQYGNLYDDCKPNGKGFWANLDPGFAARNYRFGDGKTYLHQKQSLASLELNYLPSDEFKLTSVTGWYDARMQFADNPSPDISGRGLISTVGINTRNFTQELRLASNLDFPVNFTVGALYARSDGDSIVDAFVGTPNRVAGRQRTFLDGDAYSAFAQASWHMVDTLELAGGARYSHEMKKAKYFRGRDPGIFDIPQAIDPAERSFNNVSPEATLTWRPSNRLTVFGAYRSGFLSGGYNANITSSPNPSYEQQKTTGFEAGAKVLALGNSLRVNLSAYRYVTTGLQVTIAFIRADGTPNAQIFNGGKMTSKGLEADFTYHTPVEGLSLHGALGYNHARYNSFSTLCYRGETIQAGCNSVFSPATGAFQNQELGGQQVVRAPDWNINGGATYETPISGSLKLSLSGDVAYTSSFFTDPRNMPGSIQKSYYLVDASLRLINDEAGWEVGIVGKNLTNERYTLRVAEATGGGTLPGLATGTVADTVGSVSRGQQIMLRASVKFGN